MCANLSVLEIHQAALKETKPQSIAGGIGQERRSDNISAQLGPWDVSDELSFLPVHQSLVLITDVNTPVVVTGDRVHPATRDFFHGDESAMLEAGNPAGSGHPNTSIFIFVKRSHAVIGQPGIIFFRDDLFRSRRNGALNPSRSDVFTGATAINGYRAGLPPIQTIEGAQPSAVIASHQHGPNAGTGEALLRRNGWHRWFMKTVHAVLSPYPDILFVILK